MALRSCLLSVIMLSLPLIRCFCTRAHELCVEILLLYCVSDSKRMCGDVGIGIRNGGKKMRKIYTVYDCIFEMFLVFMPIYFFRQFDSGTEMKCQCAPIWLCIDCGEICLVGIFRQDSIAFRLFCALRVLPPVSN